MTVLAAIELSQLLKVVWVSLLGGLVVIAAFSIVVRASARSAEARRSGAGTAAALHALVAAVAFAVFAAAVVFGLVIMLKK
jgi:hypothetical protein